MSWAEDNNIDCGLDDPYEGIEENWDNGFHVDQNGKKWRIKKINNFHLRNIIKYFEDYLDVSVLLKELNKRNTTWTKIK